jgi:hypothetical protein
MLGGKVRTREPASADGRSPLRCWVCRIVGAGGRGSPERPDASVRAQVERLPALLDCSRLPNGIVELVLDDPDASLRRLFDVHDGVLTQIDPGSAVPWTSIAGSACAWACALGPERDLAGLQAVGDARLARSVLAALP